MRAALLLTVIAIAAGGCKVKDPPPIDEQFTDDFERDEIGSNYYKTGGDYEIVDGRLRAANGYNHPLWLRKRLPRDVKVEVDVWAETAVGDIKVELFGDGRSHATHKGAYNASGYVAVFGGWSNSRSILARQREHGRVGRDLAEDKARRVKPQQKYHWTLVRKGDTVEWSIDGQPFLSFTDAVPLEGSGHGYFGFNNWESPTWFDNLVITPL